MKLAVIPARGGSKRIPRKNIRLFNGRPAIAYAIEAAQQAECFDRVVVSTDDHEIAAVARDYGVEAPFMRPNALADDHAGTMPVVRHAVEWFDGVGEPPEYVCCIYATAVFLRSRDIRRGLELIIERNADYAVTVTSFPFPIQRAVRIVGNSGLEMFWPENRLVRSQDLEPAYHDAGQLYWGLAQAFREERAIFERSTVPVLIPRHRVQDIDTQEDWYRAELMFRALRDGDGDHDL